VYSNTACLNIIYCTYSWSPSEVVNEQNWAGHNDNYDNYYYEKNNNENEDEDDGEEDREEEDDRKDRARRFLAAMLGGDQLHRPSQGRRRLDELRYFQCGYNDGEDQWQNDFRPCLNANVAYSLYGTYSWSVSAKGTGCGKGTYINTFFTTDGLYSFIKALQLNIPDYSSYYGWENVDDYGYTGDGTGEAEDDYAYGNNNNNNGGDNDKDQQVKGYYADNVVDNYQAGQNGGNARNNYYGRYGYDEYGNNNQNQYTNVDGDGSYNEGDAYGYQYQYQYQNNNNGNGGNYGYNNNENENNNEEEGAANNNEEEAANNNEEEAAGNNNEEEAAGNNYGYNNNEEAAANNYGYNNNEEEAAANNYYRERELEKEEQGVTSQGRGEGEGEAKNQRGRSLGYYGYQYYQMEEEDESADDPTQVIPFVSGGGTCRNKVKYGYSLGIGCAANNNGKGFTIDQFEGYYCDASQYLATVNSLESLNHAIYNSGGKCMEIYNKGSNTDYASRLMRHSKACSPQIYGNDVCPDPYHKLAQCEQKMYWAERGLHQMKTDLEVRRIFATGTLLLILAAVFIFLALSELRDRNPSTDVRRVVELTEQEKREWRSTAGNPRFDDTSVGATTINSLAPPSNLRKVMSGMSHMKRENTDFDDWDESGEVACVAHGNDTGTDDDPIAQAYSSYSERSVALDATMNDVATGKNINAVMT
jgi:hypothetical protein